MRRIYLDYNAGAPLDRRLLEVLVRQLQQEMGNPSSVHFQGQQCRQRLEESRRTVARFFRVQPREVFFTSGGTEGAALLLQGVLRRHSDGQILSSEVEHACVYQTVKAFESRGFDVAFLPVGSWGSVRAEAFAQRLSPQTRLISLMAANNETGVVTDIAAIAAVAQQAGVPFVVDGVGWLGKELVSIPPGVSALFFSGHKIGAPKGVGFCICRSSLKLAPLFFGGEQEFGRRPGTENLPGIVALGEAIALLEQEQVSRIAHMRTLRDQLEKELLFRLPGVEVNGEGPRVSNITNLAFAGVDGETLLMHLDREGISASHGSACTSGALEPSRILLKMGLPLSRVRTSLRFSVGPTTTREEIAEAVEGIIQVVERLRGPNRLEY